MHIVQELFVILLLLQTIDASLTQLNRDRRSPNIRNIRLSGNGSTQFRGRVEIQGPNGTWGTICDDSFDGNDATVICRMLGFPRDSALAYQSAYFGQGIGPIWLDDLGCNGTETTLEQCTSNGWGRHNCQHSEDAAIDCKIYIQNIRLSGNGSTHFKGRVEIQGPNGTWGTICDDNFDGKDATVICRMLGFKKDSALAYQSAHFGQGIGPIWLDDLGCNGTETTLEQCTSNGWGRHNCQHSEDAAIDCKRYIQNIRLSGNGSTQFKGRVEIQGPNGTWGTICDDNFDGKDATVICRMLGFKKVSAFAYQSAHFGRGYGAIWLDDLNCNGAEIDLEQCTSREWGQHDCTHYEDAAVDCEFMLRNIRLAGNGSTNSRGRVEVLNPNGTWGTICDTHFDWLDAEVICRMLGFTSGSLLAYYNSYFGTGSGPDYTLDCRGHETHINQCPSRQGLCSNGDESGVSCGLDAVVQNIRLVGRRGAHEGRVGILGPDGKWGTLTNINANAASVICRMAGFNKGYMRIFSDDFFGEGSGPTYYCVNYRCAGQETNIAQCCTPGFKVNYYAHVNDIGLSCQRDNNIRLVGGNSELEGRVEVYHNGVWGTVCNNGFDYRDAEVICYMLGYDTRSIQLYTYARYGQVTGQIWLNNLSCNGTEATIDECPSLTWGSNSCSHSQDVGVDCRQRVRLYGGRYLTEGYVQLGNDWQTICGNSTGENEARAVCHSLHFNMSYWYPNWYSQHGSVNISKIRLSCRGTESDVAECKQGRHTDFCNYYYYINCTESLSGRLVGGAHRWEGKFQLQNKLDYRWYRVCTDVWTDKEATLFCQLISRDIKGEVYGRVNRNTAFDQQSGSFVFLSTRCNIGIPFCIFEINSTQSCPYTDIAMTCTHLVRDSQNSVRLVGGQNEYEGRVEIKFNNTWYTLCEDSWDQNDAVVVCRSRGYWVSTTTAYRNASFGQGSLPSLLIYPYCNSYEPSIFDCLTGNTWGSLCSHSRNAGVRCTPKSLGRDKVRLAYGSAPSNGKLEVFYNGQWGGACMKSWTQRNTEVVCRMMMYHSSMPYYNAFKGISTTILIGDLQCRGDEADIGLCKASLDKSNCTDEVVGIDCFGVNECLFFPCQHGGNCTRTNDTYSCNCPSGWQGKNCSTDVNECLSSPCEHGGNCINTNGTYSCDCALGWQGKDCTTDDNECLFFPCQHGGSCNNEIGTYWCNCPIGWQGRNCSTDVNECLSYPCKHGGTCINTNGTYSCNCPCGWEGKDCTTATQELNEEPIVLHAAVGSLAGLLAISALLICCLIRKIRRMQKQNQKERPHAKSKTAVVKNREYYNMSIQEKTKIRNTPNTLCTISGRTPSNESLHDDHVYMTLDIVEKNF